MLFTVVIDTGDAEQDVVLEELEQLPSVVLVQFMGPGALVGAAGVERADRPAHESEMARAAIRLALEADGPREQTMAMVSALVYAGDQIGSAAAKLAEALDYGLPIAGRGN